MNLSPHWEALFHGLQMEAVHWTKLGAIDAPDTEIMTFAAREDFVVLTHDLDFGSISRAAANSALATRGPIDAGDRNGRIDYNRREQGRIANPAAGRSFV